jgi:hypothetical protein
MTENQKIVLIALVEYGPRIRDLYGEPYGVIIEKESVGDGIRLRFGTQWFRVEHYEDNKAFFVEEFVEETLTSTDASKKIEAILNGII